MFKRQRSDREVVTACDLADAVEQVQNLVPDFSLERILDKTRTIQRMLREIPHDVHQLYSLLANRDWHMEISLAGEKKGQVYLEVYKPLSEKEQLRQQFLQFGFKNHSFFPQEYLATRPDLLKTELEIEDIRLDGVHSNPSALASQLMILRDRHKNPMALLSRNYEISEVNYIGIDSNE